MKAGDVSESVIGKKVIFKTYICSDKKERKIYTYIYIGEKKSSFGYISYDTLVNSSKCLCVFDCVMCVCVHRKAKKVSDPASQIVFQTTKCEIFSGAKVLVFLRCVMCDILTFHCLCYHYFPLAFTSSLRVIYCGDFLLCCSFLSNGDAGLLIMGPYFFCFFVCYFCHIFCCYFYD